MDEGESPTLERTRALWNGNEDEFTQAISELIQRGVLYPVQQPSNGKAVWMDLTSNWRKIVTPVIY